MNHGNIAGKIRQIAFLGNHLPRQCGIATFTTDLSSAMAAEFSSTDCFVVAMNDPGKQYAYPPRVRFEVVESDIASYRRAADFLNSHEIDVVSVQHEYGIFGGKAGSYLLAFLRNLRMPIVTTVHTMLGKPDSMQRRAMNQIARLSKRLVVMSAHGATLLHDVHGVAKDKIDISPHGIPSVPVAGGTKKELGLDGKSMLLTFGLLSPDKGIEHVIDALPGILTRKPNTVYVVLGATHPHLKERYGESYRESLARRAQELGVASSVIFDNRFVSSSELVRFLAAADIYITPYLKMEQSTSGTLAYAVGSGKAVISTPYLYAQELLADGRGIIVPPRDSQAIARTVIDLLSDDAKRLALCERAAVYGRSMVWSAVARRYLRSFDRACSREKSRPRVSQGLEIRARRLST
jgi:glycosyltransferase involved in cell wall biosynthesis